MTDPKPFQVATIDVAEEAFKNRSGSRRFLVADEVGLGKTVVAQHVIHRMMKRKRGSAFVVFYVCSNLSIASQNRDKLLEIIPEKDRKDAQCQVDRLTLLPAASAPQHPKLHLYTLTPDTSIPDRGGMRRDGKAQERALIHVMVEKLWPEFFKRSGYKKTKGFFRRQVTRENWPGEISYAKKQFKKLTKKERKRLLDNFYISVRKQLHLRPKERVCKELVARGNDLDIIVTLRSALAACAVEDIKPDLVIFDEFQRFRDLLSDGVDASASRVIKALRGDSSRQSPSLMLLSATPYRLYSRRWEDGKGASHHEEFFELVKFLAGGGKKGEDVEKSCSDAFLSLELEIRKGQLDSKEAHKARMAIRELLVPLMSRTERASHDFGWSELKTNSLPAPLNTSDLKIFRHLKASLKEGHDLQAVPYWTSIPLPMQTMGPRYKVWEDSTPKTFRGVPNLQIKDRDVFKKPEKWPHPRLRSLLAHLPIKQLCLPWLPPSLPWWKLGGYWKEENGVKPGKTLIFSRFRAVPQAIASFISYELEHHLFENGDIPYQDISKRRSLRAAGKSYPVLALFHPSPWICNNVDPLKGLNGSIDAVRSNIRIQLIDALSALDISIQDQSGNRPDWKLIAAIEAKSNNWEWIHSSWGALQDEIGKDESGQEGMGSLLDVWNAASKESLTHISERELGQLVDYALAAPGNIVGRALQRHWPEALNAENYLHVLKTCWNGLRAYLSQRWFFALLGGDESNYPTALRKATIDGNLEAVLDEHLWIIQKLKGEKKGDSGFGPKLAGELKNALKIRTSTFTLHTPEKSKDASFSLRCHVAMPFTEAKLVVVREDGEQIEGTLRTDELRRSFNTPFWPHILTTTSVGQEGLDFHVWCSKLIHWDLCGNPMDLEQREGRIQRFGGLSVRRAISNKLGAVAFEARNPDQSPWEILGDLAEEHLGNKDASGLSPWWVCEDAEVERYVFHVPSSDQQERLAWLKEQRMLYRLALGQPNQEDLIEVLSARNNIKEEELRKVSIGLSAFFDKDNQ